MWPFEDRVPQPSEECVKRGSKLWFLVESPSGSHTGTVQDQEGVVHWRYHSRKTRYSSSLSNPFRKPDFVFRSSDDSTEIVIRRYSFMPSVFHVLKMDRLIGNVRLAGIFRNRYSFSIDGSDWKFRMPLYTITFYGSSSAGAHVWARLGRSKREWGVLIGPGVEAQAALLGVLAFIHNEWWRYG
jgi:hypothetical protein